MALYLSRLPTDLFTPLFLNFSSDELLHIIPQLKGIWDFNSKLFWKTIWRRDISSFTDPPIDSEQTWTNYQVIYNILRSNTDEKIKYLVTNGCDILVYPLMRNIHMKDCCYMMRYAAEAGHGTMVNRLIELGANNYNYALLAAVSAGRVNIVKLLISKGATNYNQALVSAASTGTIEIVKLMLELGATSYNAAMEYAAAGGQIKVVELMLHLGANNYNEVMCVAACSGNRDIIELMLQRLAGEAIVYNSIIPELSKRGHIDCLKFILSITPKSIINYGSAMKAAAKGKHMNILRLLFENGATDYYEGIKYAAENNDIETIELIMSYIKNNQNK